jgi:hypothetical protein
LRGKVCAPPIRRRGRKVSIILQTSCSVPDTRCFPVLTNLTKKICILPVDQEIELNCTERAHLFVGHIGSKSKVKWKRN